MASRLAFAALIACWLVFAFSVLVLRYQVLPDIARYQPDIEQLTSKALGLPVRIGGVRAGWEGLRPELFLDDVRVVDRAGREALSLKRVEVVLSWRSLVFFELRLHRLLAEGPQVEAERLADGRVMVAGFQVYPSAGGDSALADWLLHQDEVAVTGARLRWRDALSAAGKNALTLQTMPELTLDAVSFRLENRGRRHRFALLASPPDALAGQLDLRGDFRGLTLARLDEWMGQLYLSAPRIDLALWRPWIETPVNLRQGRGGLKLWGSVDGFGMADASVDMALADVRLTLDSGADRAATVLPELDLESFQGRLSLRKENRGGKRGSQGYRLSGLDLSLRLRDGLAIAPTSFQLQWMPLGAAPGSGSEGLAVFNQLDLGHFAKLAEYLPLDRASRDVLQRYSPEGTLRNLRLTWRGNAESLQRFSMKVDFAELGMRAHGLLPGFDGLSGALTADETQGQLEIASVPLVLQFPAVFPQPSMALDELNARLAWTIKSDLLEVTLNEASFSGPDVAGSSRGRYRLGLSDKAPKEFQSPGELDLTAHLSEGDATAVWRYLPHLIAADVRQWVHDAVRGGKVRSADLVLRGPLAEFPFPKNERGQFLVKAKISDGQLLYAPGWPEVSELETDLRFEGAGAQFSSVQSTTAGVKLGKVQAGIADFSVKSPLLTISGDAQGPLPGFTRFLDQSPLGEMLGRFYEDIRISGDGKLTLGLEIPLDNPESARVKGELDVTAGTVLIDPLLPPVTAFNGRVSFTENSAQAKALAGQFFGRPVQADLRAQGNEVRVAAFGAATAGDLQRQYPFPLLNALSGSLPWQAAVSVRDGRVGFAVESSLEGLQSNLPEPFRKSAEQSLAVRFSRAPQGEPAGKAGKTTTTARPVRKNAELPRDQLRLVLGDLAGATLIRRLDPGHTVIERGIAAVGAGWAAAPLPEKGLRVVVNQPSLDLDQWRTAWNAKPAANEARATLVEGVEWPTPQLDLRAQTVRLIGRQWHAVAVSATPMRGGIAGRLEARDMAGEWSWDNAGKGTLHARLKQLVLPDVAGETTGGAASVSEPGAALPEAPEDLPALDLVAEQLVLGDRRLGRLEVQAENTSGRWLVPRFQLSSPDGKVSGNGVWTLATGNTPPASLIDFSVDASDLGKLLGRFGYPDAVRRGQGQLSGRLAWQGAPTNLHPASLNGALALHAERGQFNKLEPGIGKLLSLLSLQMLPRRITLDFRDVFSEGFAFETIKGNVQVNRGVFATDNLVIEGPAAKVLMNGNADLANDRTQLHVLVQPELGTSFALGAAVAVNPVVGVAALLAQKLLQDPFNKVFAFEYEVTGSLSDPQVNKVGEVVPALRSPASMVTPPVSAPAKP